MNPDHIVGYVGNAEMLEQFFLRVIEAEKKMGPLSREERTVILQSMASPVTLEEVMDMIAGKRILIVKDSKNEKI